MNEKLIQSGELVVVEKGEIRISLGHKEPCEIEVKFLHDKIITPCNPDHNFDELEWELVKIHEPRCEFELNILWQVSLPRTIVWVAEY